MFGLIVPSVTPFREAALDLAGVKKLVDYYRRTGVKYLFPVGTTGEFPLLTTNERKQLLEAFAAASGDDIELIPHVGAGGLVEAKDLTAHAAGLGVRYVAAVTPYFFAHDQQSLIDFYRDLCASQPGIQFFAYTIPQRAGNTLTVESIAALRDIPNLIGVKDSTGDLDRLVALTKLDGLQIVAGADLHALPFLRAGGKGFVSGPGSIIPELFQALVEAHQNGDSQRSEKVFAFICEFAHLIGNGGRIDQLRHGLRWRGVDTGASRRPLPGSQDKPLDFAILDAFARRVNEAGIPFPERVPA